MICRIVDCANPVKPSAVIYEAQHLERAALTEGPHYVAQHRQELRFTVCQRHYEELVLAG